MRKAHIYVRPANLWISKTELFNPQSCILLTKIVLKTKNKGQCLLQFLHTGRIVLMDYWFNMHDFVMTAVFDEPNEHSQIANVRCL